MNTGIKKSHFLKQAGILAAAGMICRIIGILYRSPLTSIIGDEGNGYYTSAYNIYAIILLLSSYSIPSAISKIIATKLALKEYHNAHRIFKASLAYVFVVGGLTSLFTFFGAGLFLEGNAKIVLWVFSPTIFISGFVGVLRGYFQAHGSMVQTSISQIVEQILNAVISILAAYFLMSMVSNQAKNIQAIYGAAGSALGTGSGVLIALLFMLLVYGLNRKTFSHRRKKDIHQQEDSYFTIMKMILTTVTPILLSTFIYNFSTSFNQVIFSKIMINYAGYSGTEVTTLYGIFAGKAVLIINIPIALASALAAAMIPTISSKMATGNKREAREKVKTAINTTMLISIPSAVGIMVLAKPVTNILFPQKDSLELASRLLMMLATSVIFYSLSTISNGILQGMGKVKLPLRNAAISLAIQTVLLVVLLLFTDLYLYGLAICMLVYSGLMCILNSLSVRKHLGYVEDFTQILFLPLLCAIVMGACARGVYEGLFWITKNSNVSLIPAILVGMMIYFAMALKLGVVNRKQLTNMPKGNNLISLGEKLHLLK